MTFRRQTRRKVHKPFNPRDVAGWRRLIREARRAVRNPGRFAVELADAARAATRCVAPPGHVHRDSVFMRLVLKATVYAGSQPETRAALATDLEALAQSCADFLDTPAAIRPRADLE